MSDSLVVGHLAISFLGPEIALLVHGIILLWERFMLPQVMWPLLEKGKKKNDIFLPRVNLCAKFGDSVHGDLDFS